MRAVLCVVCVVVAGCQVSRVAQTPDGSSDVDAGGFDAGSVDGGPDAGGVCTLNDWHLETRPIDSVTPLFPDPSIWGTTEQLDVAVRLTSACDLLASIDDVGYSGNATDFVGLIAHVWTHSDCPSPAHLTVAHRIWRVTEWGNYRLVVGDRSSDQTEQLLTYGRELCTGTDCSCYPGAQHGTTTEGLSCHTDCSCAAGLSCLCATGVATAEPCVCARPCNDFLDCGAYERCDTSLVRACASGGNCPDGQCPAGWVCQQNDPRSNTCEDRRAQPGASCHCDADCGAGELCIGSGGAGLCRVPCWHDADCPASHGLACIASLCQLPE